VASHCYKWMPYTDLTADEEEEYIRKAVLSFQKTSPSGKVPRGWYYGRPSARSVPLVAKVYKELGHELKWWSVRLLFLSCRAFTQAYPSSIPGHVCRRPSLLRPSPRKGGQAAHHGSLLGSSFLFFSPPFVLSLTLCIAQLDCNEYAASSFPPSTHIPSPLHFNPFPLSVVFPSPHFSFLPSFPVNAH
jgi:hypothetical protein